MLLLLVWLQDAQQCLQRLVALPVLLRRVLVPLWREHVSVQVPLHCMNSLVPTASLVPPLSSSRRETRRLIYSMPASPVCRCRFAASAASRTKDLCAASAAVAVHHHAWQCRRRSFVRAEGASSALPVASRAWRCSAERLLSTVRPSTSCTDTTIASSLAGASGGGERECVLGVESILDGHHWGHMCRRHGSPLCAYGISEYDGLRSFLQSTTLQPPP